MRLSGEQRTLASVRLPEVVGDRAVHVRYDRRLRGLQRRDTSQGEQKRAEERGDSRYLPRHRPDRTRQDHAVVLRK